MALLREVSQDRVAFLSFGFLAGGIDRISFSAGFDVRSQHFVAEFASIIRGTYDRERVAVEKLLDFLV